MAGGPLDFEFGDVRVDLGSERVFRGGEPVLLEPKAFELLVYLLERVPFWSADGRHVVFTVYGESRRRGFWSIDIASREETFVRPFPSHGNFEGALSPDGETFAFNSTKNGGVINLWLISMSSDSDDGRQLTHDTEMMGWPSGPPTVSSLPSRSDAETMTTSPSARRTEAHRCS